MTDTSAPAVALFTEELRLCGVRPGEQIAILAPEGEWARERSAGFLMAARALGGDAYIVTLPGDQVTLSGLDSNPLQGRRAVIELLKQADLMIDLMLLLFSPEQIEIQGAGCRVLLCVEPLPILRRLMPDPSLRARAEAATERLARASEVRISSAAGTDVSYRLGSYPVLTQYGHTDTPGRWDHWPSGFVATHGDDDGVHGTIVVERGDVLCLPVMRFAESRVELVVRDGYVVDVRGDGLDAMLIREFLPDPADDRDAWAVSHVGWGLMLQATWMGDGTPGAFGMEQRSVAGNVMVSTGPNTELGGTRTTAYHLDIPMRGCTLELDGEPVVESGTLTDGAPARP